ncbi:MAG TPA: UDP-glucose/GDP-mannose dehydrogenase family protein [Thermodesulfobacteriota bacterium]|jgi:UDPglucose 6-dehydrogenase|nr:UDP-glucose/GDP-mannose dehydrogenase family protein [Thermodesulfobacteriota bacterium]
MNICIIGTGYVGLVTGACLAEFGMSLVCVDNDRQKIELLRQGKVTIHEPGLEDLVAKNMREGRLSFSTSIEEGVKSSLVIFIAVGTPSDADGSADLKFIEEVAQEIARNMDGYKVVVVKSTVPVGTCRRLKQLIKDHQVRPTRFDIVSNPEFQREGSAIEDFMRPDRVTIGAESEQAIAIMKDIYSALYIIETPFVITSLETAEMIKYASNSFLATKISFINEIANLCEAVGADVHHVARAMGLDGRIGKKFLHPGPGYGGSCFPKDTRALWKMAQESGYSFKILDAVIKANEEQKKRMIGKIIEKVGDLKGKTIGILGLSFKPNTDDIRESSSIVIIQGLLDMGAKVKAFDPAAMEEAKAVLPGIEFGKDAYDVAKGVDALVLATEWNQFRRLDLTHIKELLKAPVFIDLRNVYDPDQMRRLGFNYCGVGR